jgi:hypothetical protein
VIFAGAGVLLQVSILSTSFHKPTWVKDVNAAQEVLIDIFEHIKNYFKCLETYTEVRPSETMTAIIVKIMVEVLNILGIAMKEIKQGRTSELTIHLLCIGPTDR